MKSMMKIHANQYHLNHFRYEKNKSIYLKRKILDRFQSLYKHTEGKANCLHILTGNNNDNNDKK